ncbi:glycoside hydrolase superfamily [Apiospora phragmitis]|uniref:alpha-galactosidase n=1 Tax=Apiospora phragmitis TaxID=2905665 RepID=A0ABR1UHX3_9PEZI
MFDSIQGDASSNVIAKLRAAQRSSVGDIFVICYFNGGALNPTDPNIQQFAADDNLGTIPGWETSTTEVVALMKKRIDAGVAGGCDVFDPDNIDGYLQPGQADYYGYVAALADHAHAAGKLLGQKNAAELLALEDGTGRGLLRDGFVDFAVTEGCAVGGGSSSDPTWCASVQPFVDAGKPVFQIEYPSEWGNDCSPAALGKSALDKYCTYATGGFSPIMKLDGDDCGLDGVTQYCGSTTIVNTPMDV